MDDDDAAEASLLLLLVNFEPKKASISAEVGLGMPRYS